MDNSLYHLLMGGVEGAAEALPLRILASPVARGAGKGVAGGGSNLTMTDALGAGLEGASEALRYRSLASPVARGAGRGPSILELLLSAQR